MRQRIGKMSLEMKLSEVDCRKLERERERETHKHTKKDRELRR